MASAFAIAVFWLVQASAVTVFLVPFEWSYAGLWAGSHFLRALGLTIIFHRYLAHRAFQLSRGARFFWALLGTAAMQKGPLWWAGNHIDHHKYADREGDPHSPALSGFYYAHIGWFLNDSKWNTLPETNPVMRDFGGAWELRWLDRYFWLPPLALGAGLYAYGGLAWLAWGFCLPTVTLAHATFAINTVNHLWGTRRFNTIDQSRNNALTAFFAVGEGWHNNHHRYQRAARNGFYWWEYDPTYWLVQGMALIGLAWDLHPVPERVYREADLPEPDVRLTTFAEASAVKKPDTTSTVRLKPDTTSM